MRRQKSYRECFVCTSVRVLSVAGLCSSGCDFTEYVASSGERCKILVKIQHLASCTASTCPTQDLIKVAR